MDAANALRSSSVSWLTGMLRKNGPRTPLASFLRLRSRFFFMFLPEFAAGVRRPRGARTFVIIGQSFRIVCRCLSDFGVRLLPHALLFFFDSPQHLGFWPH